MVKVLFNLILIVVVAMLVAGKLEDFNDRRK